MSQTSTHHSHLQNKNVALNKLYEGVNAISRSTHLTSYYSNETCMTWTNMFRN